MKILIQSLAKNVSKLSWGLFAYIIIYTAWIWYTQWNFATFALGFLTVILMATILVMESMLGENKETIVELEQELDKLTIEVQKTTETVDKLKSHVYVNAITEETLKIFEHAKDLTVLFDEVNNVVSLSWGRNSMIIFKKPTSVKVNWIDEGGIR